VVQVRHRHADGRKAARGVAGLAASTVLRRCSARHDRAYTLGTGGRRHRCDARLETDMAHDSVPAPDPAPAPATNTTPAPRADLNSRVERRLWVLYRGSDRAEARVGIKFGHREFRVYVNGGLLWSRNYALDDVHLDADAAAKHQEFVDAGWLAEGV